MDSKISISDRIEKTIIGFFKFIASVIVTVFSGIFLPHTLGQTNVPKKLDRIQPFTLLAIGSFLYAIVLGPSLYQPKPDMGSSILSNLPVYPDYQEISIEIYREIISTDIWNVILRGFPVLIVSALCIYAASLLLLKKDIRFQGLKVLVYGIAIQLIYISLLELLFIFSFLLNVFEGIPQPLYLILTNYVMLIPLIAFGYWYYKQVEESKVQLAFRLPIILLVSIGILVSLPKVTHINQIIFSSSQQEYYVELKIYDHTIFNKNYNNNQKGAFSIPITITNKTDSTIVIDTEYTTIAISHISNNKDFEPYSYIGYLQEFNHLKNGEPIGDLMEIKPNTSESYRVHFNLFQLEGFVRSFDLFAPWLESGDEVEVLAYLDDEFLEIEIGLNSLEFFGYTARQKISYIRIE